MIAHCISYLLIIVACMYYPQIYKNAQKDKENAKTDPHSHPRVCARLSAMSGVGVVRSRKSAHIVAIGVRADESNGCGKQMYKRRNSGLESRGCTVEAGNSTCTPED